MFQNPVVLVGVDEASLISGKDNPVDLLNFQRSSSFNFEGHDEKIITFYFVRNLAIGLRFQPPELNELSFIFWTNC